MAAEAHLPLIVFKSIVEVNILSEVQGHINLAIDQLPTNILTHHKDCQNDTLIIGKLDIAAYQKPRTRSSIRDYQIDRYAKTLRKISFSAECCDRIFGSEE
jgi:hypothetical protein